MSDTPTTIQRRLLISGKVQGVGFRASTLRQAATIGASLRGWVRNLPDGRVEVLAMGPAQSVQDLVRWCRSGPPSAQVTQLEEIEEKVDSSLKAFDLKRS